MMTRLPLLAAARSGAASRRPAPRWWCIGGMLCCIVSVTPAALPPTAVAQPDFARCIDALRAELPRHPQVRAETFETAVARAEDLRPPIDSATRNQPEIEWPVWDYLARLVDAERIADGRAVLERDHEALAQIEARFGVDAATLVAIFGIESDFGRVRGRHDVVDATLSRACLQLSNRERKAHFFAALWLLQEGRVRPQDFRGSWAGAFGLTRFMPATFVRQMADGDGDGRIDIVTSRPDAWATTANYLHGLGWVTGLPWGIEVRVPPGVAQAMGSAGREHACLAAGATGARCRRFEQWAALGVRRADGGALNEPHGDSTAPAPSTLAALLTPAGADGPAWLVTRNFHALWQYNRADAYALAIGLLSSALRNEPPVLQRWPVSEAERLLSRAELLALQRLLRETGRCALEADGFDGPLTRQAIRDEQARRGLPPTGRPTQALLALLRGEPAAAVDCSAAAAAMPAPNPAVDPD